MTFRQWILPLCVIGLLTIAGCPSRQEIKPDESTTEQPGAAQTDGGVDGGTEVADGGTPSLDGGTAEATPDGGPTSVAAGGNDAVETPEEKAGREAREKEEAEKKAIEAKRAEEDAKIKKLKAEIDSRLT